LAVSAMESRLYMETSFRFPWRCLAIRLARGRSAYRGHAAGRHNVKSDSRWEMR